MSGRLADKGAIVTGPVPCSWAAGVRVRVTGTPDDADAATTASHPIGGRRNAMLERRAFFINSLALGILGTSAPSEMSGPWPSSHSSTPVVTASPMACLDSRDKCAHLAEHRGRRPLRSGRQHERDSEKVSAPVVLYDKEA